VSAETGSVPARRRVQISRYVQLAESVQIEEMAERFGVSVMTIHRDLDVLASEGWLEKTRGGAKATALRLHERNVKLRWRQQNAEKRALARAALSHLRPGLTLAMDDSTTVAAMLPLLGTLRPLTVITNFLPALVRAAADPDIDVIGLGGQFDRSLDSFEGPAGIDQLRSLSADAVVMSPSAVHRGSLFHPSTYTARRKHALLEIGELKMLLVDSTKFERRATHRLGSVELFDLVLVDSGVSEENIESITSLGVEVQVVKVTPEDRAAPPLEGCDLHRLLLDPPSRTPPP